MVFNKSNFYIANYINKYFYLKIIYLITFSLIINNIFFPSYQNILCSLITLIGLVISFNYIFYDDSIAHFPISTLTILGFVTYHFILPPIITTFYLVSLTNNLIDPILVFINSFLTFVTLILSHYIYKKSKIINSIKYMLQNKLYIKLGFFKIPTRKMLLVMGVLGCLSYLLSAGNIDSSASITNNIFGIFRPLISAPYAMLLYPSIGGADLDNKKAYTSYLLIYSLLVISVAISASSRTPIVIGFSSILILFFYCILIGNIRVVFKKIRVYLVVFLIGSFLLAGPIADLSISILVARDLRGLISPMELLNETINIFNDNSQLERYREIAASSLSINLSGWDELYINNALFSRLANLKFTDNSIQNALSLNNSDLDQYRNFEIIRALSPIPSPILNLFGLSESKAIIIGGSGGDFLYSLSSGDNSAIGGFRTGSLIGSSLALFGVTYPFFLFLAFLLAFPFLDSVVLLRYDKNRNLNEIIFNVIGASTLFSSYFIFTSAASGIEDFGNFFQIYLRYPVQIVIIYFVAFKLASISLFR